MTDLNDIYLNVRHCRYMQDPPGREWGPRTIPDYELILIIKGQYLYIDTNGQVLLTPGDILFIEPEYQHVFRKLPEDEGIHVCAHFDLIDNAGNIYFMHQLGCKPQRKTIASQFDLFHMAMKYASEQFISYSRFHKEIVNSSIRQVWLKVAEKWFETTQKTVSEKVNEMMNYMRNNMTRPISRMDLAEKFHYTPEHINYLFKKELGISPSRFLNRERAIKGFRLLYEEGLSVQQTAAKTGFSSQYYFSRVFKDIFGYPPSKIKKYITGNIEEIFEKSIIPNITN
ncbi:MAG: helix-turn-helix transcriptional regulator [Phycisphaerae bacterium]|nr:helix-turn-helix transcriptional regulator [Phycisphaerae bacterium]